MYRFRADKRASSQHGFVLLATLWVMVLLGVLLATMSYQVRIEATLERRFLDQSQLRLAARGAIHMAMARISAQDEQPFHSPQDEWWATVENWQNIELGDVQIDLGRVASPANDSNEKEIQNQIQNLPIRPLESALLFGPVDGESRLNINIATVDQLTLVPGFTDEIAERIVEYRDSLQPEGFTDDAGSEKSTVADSEDDQVVELFNGPLGSVETVLLSIGIDLDELKEQRAQQLPLEQLLTNVSSGRINVNTAPLEVLATLGLTSEQIKGLLTQRKSAPIQSTSEIAGALGLTEESDEWVQLKAVLDTRSATFELSAQATLENKKPLLIVDAFVFSDGERIRIVSWAERVSNG